MIYCPHPLEFINPIVAEFEGRTGIRVYVQTGGTGELLKMAEEGRRSSLRYILGRFPVHHQSQEGAV